MSGSIYQEQVLDTKSPGLCNKLTHAIHPPGIFQLISTHDVLGFVGFISDLTITKTNLRHNAAILPAFSSPKCVANSFAILSVESNVPYLAFNE